MIDPYHLLEHVIRPVLKDLELHSDSAEKLVMGTACKESACGLWLVQLGGGPGLGIYQCEPATLSDIWANFLNHNQWGSRVRKFATMWPEAQELVGNLYYATAICRIHYLRFSEPIPDNLEGQAAYWKRYYNTELGKGTVEEYIAAWQRFVPPGLFREKVV